MNTRNDLWFRIESPMRVIGRVAMTALLLGFAPPARAALLSTGDPSLAVPAGGNGDSVAPSLSAEGRFVLFSSSGNNLVPGDNSRLSVDVFLRDRAAHTTTLVSVNQDGIGGGNGNSSCGQVSTNGRFVLFESEASDLVPGDSNIFSDVIVRDLMAGTTLRVSLSTNGSAANGPSADAVMTPDAHYVALVSYANNLVAGDTNNIADVFVRDLVGGTTRQVTAGALAPVSGTAFMGAPRITPDGRYVAFFSTARELTPGAPSSPAGEVYLRDLIGNTMTRVSSNAAAVVNSVLGLSNMPSFHPVISDDGRYVAFKTGWTNIYAAPTGYFSPGPAMIFRYDTVTLSNVVVSTNGYPASTWTWQGVDDIYGPEMTPDGRFVAFVQREEVGSTAYSSVHVWDAQSGADILVSDNGSGVSSNTYSHTPVINPDGRFVAFLSNATNLVGNVVSNGYHIYLRDLQSATTQLVDVDTNGVASTDEERAIPSLSADGRYVAFNSPDGGLVNADNNRALDVFLRDAESGSTELVSAHDPAFAAPVANGWSFVPLNSISDDGRFIAFASFADNLVPNDVNGAEDVFVHDLQAGANILVSASSDGGPAWGQYSDSPAISGNGRYVAFVSTATNLVAGGTKSFDIYLRDLQVGSNLLVSVNTNGVSAGGSSSPVVSRDGRRVAFLSFAHDLAPGVSGVGPHAFWRDLDSGLTLAPAGSADFAQPPTMTSDGRYVAHIGSFGIYSSYLRVWDSQTTANIYSNAGPVNAAVISPSGSKLAYQSGGSVVLVDVVGHSNILSVAGASLSGRPWSANDRYFVLVTASKIASADLNNTKDIYLCDTETRALTLVSLNSALTGSANGPSDSPVISGDGRFVAYRSFATNIVAGPDPVTPNLFLYDRLAGTNRLLTAGQSGAGWLSWVSRPALNFDGSTVAFQSVSPGLVPEDWNRLQDVFAVAPDSDADGIPDWWMTQYFGHPTAEAGDVSRPQDDADGDGISNWQEYLTGTDPTDPASALRLQIARVTSGDVALTWLELAGRNYQVQYTDDLANPDWQILPGIPTVTGYQASLVVPSTAATRFYRLVETN